MAGDVNNGFEGADSVTPSTFEATETLNESVDDMSISEQQSILRQESERVEESTREHLPELSISSELGASQAKDLFAQNEKRIDWNEDGLVSASEINLAVEDGSI